MKVKEIAKLLSPQTLQKIQDSYTLALGLPITIKDLDGETILPTSNHGKLWNLIINNPSLMTVFNEQLTNTIEKCLRTGQIMIFERHSDCFAFLAPIYANGKIIAFFLSGMVRFGNPNLSSAEQNAATLHIDIDTYLDAFLSLPFLTKERLEASANLIRIIGSTIYSLEDSGTEIKEKNNVIKEENQKLNENLRNTTQKLHESENRYKQIFDTVNDGIYLADFDNDTFLEINQAGAKILGFNAPTDLIGKNIASRYDNPDHRKQFKQQLRQNNGVSNWVAHVVLPSGQHKFVETNATLLIDDITGRPVIQGIFRDLGNRHHRSVRPSPNGQ